MPEFDRSELLEYFLAEADDHISTLDRGISELESNPDSNVVIEELFRAAHTLKGAAALVKLDTTSNIAHKMEDILEELKEENIRPDKRILDLLSQILDVLKALIHDIADGRAEKPELEDDVSNMIEDALAKERAASELSQSQPIAVEPLQQEAADVSDTPILAVPEKREAIGRRKEDFEFFSGNFIKVDVRKVETMLNIIGEITVKKNYLFQKTKETEKVSDEIFFAGKRLLEEITNFSEKYAYAMPGYIKYIDPLLSEFGELEFDRYDELNLFSRKLQEITNDITEALKEMTIFFNSFNDDVSSIETMVNSLRSDVSDMRMINIGRLFQRFSKSVKDMAKQYNKKVELLLSGGDTKIDKVIFERLFDPLMHIIRNSIAHGIESPEERVQKGKKEEGLIFMSARREGANVIIEVNDNGRGIDKEKIFNEAVKRGLLKSTDKPTREEILSVIFTQGFSTSETADMTSGRGVGMNIVRRRVAAINGILEVDTEEGWGTTVRIKVPSSLAITNVIVFSSGKMEFVMPVSLIDEIMQIDVTFSHEGEAHMMNYRGSDIIAKNLSEILGLVEKADNSDKPALICNLSNRKVGLIVDSIIGQEETIIRPMNRFLAGLPLYAGSTISGDGRVRLVLNPTRIFEEEVQPTVMMPEKVADEYQGKHVLIVDDSLSVRKYISMFLEARKFKVHSATNGLEALNILESSTIDMVITDLEMPVMHGYELIDRIRNIEELKKIPIIVLTSRSAEKHKDKAIQAGANDFLVKPFDEKSLTGMLSKYLSVSA
ncbi:MAG: response regulator [Nitrospiraceae bacterium]|nr:response regulator [Nitrospiraceae bacterium]